MDENEVDIVEAQTEAAVEIAEVQAEAAVEIAKTEAELQSERLDAITAAVEELRGARDDIGALRSAFESHVESNNQNFAGVSERMATLEAGVAVMHEALVEAAEEIEEETSEDPAVEVVSVETPPSDPDVPQPVPDEPKPADEVAEHRHKRHFIRI